MNQLPDMPIREIGGKKFRHIIAGNLEHDNYMRKIIRHSGVETLRRNEGESDKEFALRVQEKMDDFNCPYELLAGILVPADLEDHEWCKTIANKTAAFLRKHTSEADKKEKEEALGTWGLFLVAGLLCREPSSTALLEAEGQPVQLQDQELGAAS